MMRVSLFMFILQLLAIITEYVAYAHAKDVCQVGQEKNEIGQWRWVLPYEYPCKCGKIIYGGINIHRPERPYEPVYAEEPVVGGNVGEFRDHYLMNCIDLKCPTDRLRTAKKGRETRRMTFKTVKAIGNRGEYLNVTCDPPSGTRFPIGQTNVACYTEDQRGNYKNCTFKVDVIDYNECTTKSHNCSTHATCINTAGSYRCSCEKGYTGDGFSCEDLDECATDSHDCSSDATCANTDGSYNCTCEDGYEGNGFSCEDIDECTANFHRCHDNGGACINTNGGYNCTCNTGYRGDGFRCADIDECTDNRHDCDQDAASCNNIDGGFSCSCNGGYIGDGVTCAACIVYDNSCYFFEHIQLKTFEEARTKCREFGAKLVSIYSQGEQDFMEENAQREAFPIWSLWWQVGYWIGLKELDTEGTLTTLNRVFVWTDATTADYTNWLPDEPNLYVEDEHCVSVTWKSDNNLYDYFGWFDVQCEGQYGYICKKHL